MEGGEDCECVGGVALDAGYCVLSVSGSCALGSRCVVVEREKTDGSISLHDLRLRLVQGRTWLASLS